VAALVRGLEPFQPLAGRILILEGHALSADTLCAAAGGPVAVLFGVVRMEQTGFRSEEDANYKGARHGWTKFLGNMEMSLGD
jgi:hypothetical protein